MPAVSSKKITDFKESDIQPMLATLTDKPFNEPGGIYEIKWDGYRTIAYINKEVVQLRSRNNKFFDDKFYPVTKAFSECKMDAEIDEEIVALNKNGVPDFGKLQSWRSEADGQLIFYAFDLLYEMARAK